MRIKMPAVRIAQADAELAPDLLTCGLCQREFALGDIVKFIQHKAHSCGKSCTNSSSSPPPPADPPESTLSNRRPSISAPITAKKGTALKEEKKDAMPSLPESPFDLELEKSLEDEWREKRKRIEEEGEICKRAKSMADVGSNTNASEPPSCTCFTCKQHFNSAWSLIIHVQSSHGLKIYADPVPHIQPALPQCASEPPTPPPLRSTPLPPLPVHPPMTAFDSHHPFGLLRMPGLPERQFPHSLNTHMFPRPASQDFRVDHLLTPPMGLSFPSPFERPPFSVSEPILGRALTPRDVPPTSLGSGDPALDFYSQRLRQLAGTNSPASSPSPRKGAVSPLPPVSSSPSTPIHPPPSSTPASECSKAASPADEEKKLQHPCDICGKKFRNRNSMLLHASEHSAQRAYTCSLCSYSCSQPGKLKRHMKTQHGEKENGGDETSNKTDSGDEDGSNDEEDLDEMEEEDDEDLEEEQDTAEDLSTRPVTSLKSSPSVNSIADKPGSVVSEVMETIGLSNIQQYSDAFRQALKESGARIKDNKENTSVNNDTKIKDDPVMTSSPSSSHSSDGQSLLTSSSLENGYEKPLKLREDYAKGILGHSHIDLAPPTMLGAFDNPFDPNKRIKFELDNNNSYGRERDSLYAGLWLPTMNAQRDLFLGLPGADSPLGRSKSSMDSALKPMVNPLKSDTNHSSALSGLGLNPPLSTPIKRESRRNDTCEYCGKIFKNCSNLTVHRRSHTGEKPYKCGLCAYACAQSSKLTRHMKTHGRLGKDVYRCRFCEMPFSVPSTLEKHMRKCVVNQNKKMASSLVGMVPPPVVGAPMSATVPHPLEDSSSNTSKDAT